MRFAVLLTLSSMSFPILGIAQDAATLQQHQHSQSLMIDGANDPQAIPDLVAYRLVLGAISKPANPTAQQLAHQAAQLHPIMLQSDDLAALKRELADFSMQYQNLIESYNADATKANASGNRADLALLMRQRDQLVQSFINEIQSKLTPNGRTAFQSFVQKEKAHMKISPSEAQQ